MQFLVLFDFVLDFLLGFLFLLLSLRFLALQAGSLPLQLGHLVLGFQPGLLYTVGLSFKFGNLPDLPSDLIQSFLTSFS